MTTIITPSAKSHERATGRWVRDLKAESKRDWIVYYIKVIFGSPIPFLFNLFLALVYFDTTLSTALIWSCTLLTLIYVVADRTTSQNREFEFKLISSDLWLLFFLLTALLAQLRLSQAGGLLQLSWIPLYFLLTFLWQLFPGLNRAFSILILGACLCTVYGIVQHFTGIQALGFLPNIPQNLVFAPLKEHSFMRIQSTFQDPRIYGVMVAILYPFPLAAIALWTRRESQVLYYLLLIVTGILSTGLLWTYHPGIWFTAVSGLMICLIVVPRKQIKVLASLAVFILLLIVFLNRSSPQEFWQQTLEAENRLQDQQRSYVHQMLNGQYQNLWLGLALQQGVQNSTEPELESGTRSGLGHGHGHGPELSPGSKPAQAHAQDHAHPSMDSKSLVYSSISVPKNLTTYFGMLIHFGAIGVIIYLGFFVQFLLMVYRVWKEVPLNYYWHRVLTAGGIGSVASYCVAGLFWPILQEAQTLQLGVFILSALRYLTLHYDSGLVADDTSL